MNELSNRVVLCYDCYKVKGMDYPSEVLRSLLISGGQEHVEDNYPRLEAWVHSVKEDGFEDVPGPFCETFPNRLCKGRGGRLHHRNTDTVPCRTCQDANDAVDACLLYTSPSPRDS